VSRAARRREKAWAEKYPPSEPCACKVCLAYCLRPGWWTVSQAAAALDARLASRMMLEPSPCRSFGVLSPAFHALGCNFLKGNRCELHDTAFQPLECRYCHHDRPGAGPVCDADLESDWNTPAGRRLVVRWCKLAGVWGDLSLYGLERLKA
jgi:hypothetical protein